MKKAMTGIVERIAAATSPKKIKELMIELEGYKYVSQVTKRRALRKAHGILGNKKYLTMREEVVREAAA